MPSGAVENHDGMAAEGDVAFDLGQVQVYRLGIDFGQNEAGPGAAHRADSAEQKGPVIVLIARRQRARACSHQAESWGFPNQESSDSSCMLEREASMDGATLFSRSA